VSNPAAAVEKLLDEGWSIRGYPPLSMNAPIDWAADPYDDSNWRYQLNAMYPLAPVFQLLAQQYDPALHEFARSVFDDWISFNIDQNVDHPFRWNDMATGIRAAYLAQLIYYENSRAGVSDPDRYRQVGLRHLQELTDPEKLATSNHGLFQLVGIAALCAVIHDDVCTDSLDYAQHQYSLLFGHQFNSEGMHLEHSPEYHLLALKTFRKIQDTGLLTLDSGSVATLDLAARNLSFLIHPDGGFAEIGDTEAQSAAGAASLDPVAKWLVSGGAAGRAPESGVWLFPETGYAVARNHGSKGGDTYLFFTAAHHSRIHKHMDTGSFEWSDRGRRILVDSGKWGYQPSRERNYVTGESAHNTLETEGVHNSPGDLPAHRAQLRSFGREGVFGLVAEMTLPRRLVDAGFRRILVGLPGEWLIVVDEIDEMLPSRHTIWFQVTPDAEIQELGSHRYEIALGSTGRLVMFPLWPVENSRAARGLKAPVFLGWYSPVYGELLPGWQVGFGGRGRRTRFATAFRWLAGDASSLSVERRNGDREDVIRLCWREAGRPVGVTLREDGDDVAVRFCE
jgi:hypothetical protein